MLVTVVRNRLPQVVTLPGEIHIREHNFVELKELSDGMKEALIALEKAGSVHVAQVADLAPLMSDGVIENRLPVDTTGAQPGQTIYSSADLRRLTLENAGKSDVLSDYSKPHTLSSEQKADREKVEKENEERGRDTGDGMVAQSLRVITPEMQRAQQEASIDAPKNGKPTSVDEVSDEHREAAKELLANGDNSAGTVAQQADAKAKATPAPQAKSTAAEVKPADVDKK